MNIGQLVITSKHEEVFALINKYQLAKQKLATSPNDEEKMLEVEIADKEIPLQDVYNMLIEIGHFYDTQLNEHMFTITIPTVKLGSPSYLIECENEQHAKFYYSLNELFTKVINGVIMFK